MWSYRSRRRTSKSLSSSNYYRKQLSLHQDTSSPNNIWVPKEVRGSLMRRGTVLVGGSRMSSRGGIPQWGLHLRETWLTWLRTMTMTYLRSQNSSWKGLNQPESKSQGGTIFSKEKVSSRSINNKTKCTTPQSKKPWNKRKTDKKWTSKMWLNRASLTWKDPSKKRTMTKKNKT